MLRRKLNLVLSNRWAENSPLFWYRLQPDCIATEKSHTGQETNLEVRIPVKIYLTGDTIIIDMGNKKSVRPQFIF